MEAKVRNYKVVDSWAGDRPSRIIDYLEEISGNYKTIDTTASDASTQVQTMGEGVYLLTGLPNWIDMASGRDIREFDPVTWRLLAPSKLVALGLRVLDETEKIVGDDIEPKSQLELMSDGVIDIPKGIKIIEDPTAPDGLRPETMTRAEMVAAKQLTQAEADAMTATEVRTERDKRLRAVLNRIERYQTQLAAGKPTTETAEIFAKLLDCAQDLRDVPAQEGFPYTVTWPMAPTA